jgi:hypothetical protein
VSDELFREVDEEIRQDRYQKIWKRYGTLVVIAVVAIIGATVAFVLWRDAQESAREADSTRFLAAVAQEQAARDTAVAELRDIARDGTPGYRFLASLREASLLADAGNTAEAVAVFDAIAADADLNETYRDMARVLAVSRGLELLAPAEIEQRLAPLNTPDHPFRITAREFLALAAIRAGDDNRARELLQENIDDTQSPPASRDRAIELLAALGG